MHREIVSVELSKEHVRWLGDLDQRESSAGRQREKQEERREKIVLGWLAHNRYRSAA